MAHHPVKLYLSTAQLSKVRNGHSIQLPANAIGHSSGVQFQTLHPSNLTKLSKAHRSGKGVRITLTPAELEGTGILDALRSGYKWIKKNSNILKPIASAVLDAGATFYPAAAPARGLVKKLTGVGPMPQGPQYFPGGQFEEFAPIRRTIKRKAPKRTRGSGIIPAGY